MELRKLPACKVETWCIWSWSGCLRKVAVWCGVCERKREERGGEGKEGKGRGGEGKRGEERQIGRGRETDRMYVCISVHI
jgi:hypothetical protein